MKWKHPFIQYIHVNGHTDTHARVYYVCTHTKITILQHTGYAKICTGGGLTQAHTKDCIITLWPPTTHWGFALALTAEYMNPNHYETLKY